MGLGELRKFVAPEFLYGVDARMYAGRYANNFGAKRVLIVTDPGVIEAGWLNELEKNLHDAGVDTVCFNEVTPNPKDYEAMKGAELYLAEGCDLIVALGGGSPMDCAKGISIVSSNKRHILEFEGVDEVAFPGPPLICIPTTAGTSADVSQFSIIQDSSRKVKIAIISKTVVPDVSLIDPVTTTTMSKSLTAETGLDALCHAFEAYVSNASSTITDVNAIEAVRLIWHNLHKAIDEPQNLDYRCNMMQGSLMAGLAFSNASLGIVHAMAHALGGLLDLPHGECNALLLEHAVEYNFEKASEKYGELAAIVEDSATKNSDPGAIKENLVQKLHEFRTKAGVTGGLGGIGVKSDELKQLAEFAIHDPCIVTNPKKANVEDIVKLYERAS